ncbi:MAG: 30S ribosome-binding factor RbfA [Egibacteraceae bacterium]
MRVERVNATILQILAELMPTLADPRIGFVTITDVRTSMDLGHAKVFYTVLPDDEDSRAEAAAGLRSAAPLLRREVASRLRVRRTPDLHFTHDPVPGRGRRIEHLLKTTQRAHDDS